VEAITITLNGREVSGRPGMSVLELARESGVEIPTLCHDPHLSPIGACRICLVEDERSGRLAASCVTPIEAGMQINTESEKVLERRATVIRLLLASHPDTCIVCDKGNRCDLRRIASDMGVGLAGLERIPQVATIEEVNPFIERDLSKCILCARCIRADHELVVQGAIDYIGRGFSSKPATLNDLPLESSDCTLCGTCVAACPTGALMEKRRAYAGTTSTAVSTVCPFCGCGCIVDLEVKDNHIVRARPGEDGTVNRGTLCVKGSFGHDFVHSSERITSPLVKVDGEFQEVSWDEALASVAAELGRVKDAKGPGSLALLASSTLTNEESYLLQRFARSVLGTNNIDNASRLHGAVSTAGLGAAVGFPGTTNDLDALEHSNVIMVVGADLASSAPIVAYAVKRAARHHGAEIILIDSQKTSLAPFASLWLRPRIGTDTALANGMASVIVSEGLTDEEFVTRKTENYQALTASLQKYTPEYVGEITGVPSEDVRRTARLLASADVASIVYGSGVAQHTTGTDAVTALANLAMLTGNIGLRGGVYAIRKACNGQGASDMGLLPDVLPGYQSLDSPEERRRFEDRWGATIPADAGLTAVEMIQQVKAGAIKAMYVVGEDPVLSLPNQSLVREGLEALDFLVVQDMFLTETAKLANVVLPASSFAEKEGTYTNFEGRVQRLHKVIDPVGKSRPDSEIILNLARAMGHALPYSSIQQISDEIAALVPLFQVPGESETRDVYRSQLGKSPLKRRRLYKGQFPSGFGRFSPVEYQPQTEPSANGYNLTLLSGGVLHHSGTGWATSNSARLSAFSPEAYVELSESDADRLGISEGSQVKVSSPAGEVTAAARLSAALPVGVVFMPNCFPSTPINGLFDIALDPRTKTPAMKACTVKLEGM
jgi:formate dehydrogenase alpha subunit